MKKESEIALTTYIALKHTQDECVGFIDGFKAAEERMYSEEEMLQALNIGFTSTDETWEECVEFTKEQFKKK